MTLPRVTVILPSFNRPEQARACLLALASLDYPAHLLDIVIADDGSAVPLAAGLEGVACPFAVTILRQANRGPAAARNLAVSAAQGEVLAFIDDDCLPHRDWVRALVTAYRAEPAALLGGAIVNGLPDNRYSAASQDLVAFLHAHAMQAYAAPHFFTTNNMACARAAFVAAGGFDERFGRAAAEDREFGLRWRRQGRPMRHVSDAVVEHRHALTLGTFWRQHRHYGEGAHRLHRLMKRDDAATPTFEGIGFYLSLLLYPLRRGRAGVGGTVLLTLSQCAMVHGYLTARRAARR